MKIVRSAGVPWEEAIEHGRFSQRTKQLSSFAGSLACGLYELAPGKTSFPLHAHHVTEEALYVLSGSAKVRTPDAAAPLRAGDYVAFPAGGPAHQLVNDGPEPLVYLAFSVYETQDADVLEYPASGKIAAGIGIDPNRTRFRFLAKDAVDFFTGED